MKITSLLAFIIFGLSTLSQFLFDVFAIHFVTDEIFREVVWTRAVVIMAAPLFLLGIDQALVRFGGIPEIVLRKYKYFIVISAVFLISLIVIFAENKLYIFLIFAIYLYSLSVLLGSQLRWDGKNVPAQVLICSWKFTFHLGVAVISAYSLLSVDWIFLMLLGVLLLPLILTGKNVNLKRLDENISDKEFISYSFIFLFFILMLGASQYTDQLFASIALPSELLKFYIAITAMFIAPATVLSTFIGFMLAPKFARSDLKAVKLMYRKSVKAILLLYPILFFITFFIYRVLLKYDLLPIDTIAVTDFVLLYFIALSRLLYSIHSSVMGMKSDKKNLLYFFIACVLGLVLQIVILLNASAYGTYSLSIILFSVLVNWLIRNVSASLLIEKKV